MPASATFGWSFASPLSMEQMKQKLNAIWEKPWTIGDSGRLGDYLAGKLTAEAVARIYERPDGYIVNLRFYSETGDVKEQVARAKARLLDDVMPAIGATKVTATDALE